MNSKGMQPAPQSTEKFDRLKAILREMFQLDRGDLDFSLYRIMNLKAKEIEGFLDNDLLPQVRTALAGNTADTLAALAEHRDPCLHGKELFLIRNLTRGRGVSFFDDYAYYPDFIVWLKDETCQHVIFLDPKGLSRYGSREQRKVSLHREIKKTEMQIRRSDPDVRLHAYVLSVTPPALISDAVRSRDDWKQQGVYFLEEDDCLKQMIEHALSV